MLNRDQLFLFPPAHESSDAWSWVVLKKSGAPIAGSGALSAAPKGSATVVLPPTRTIAADVRLPQVSAERQHAMAAFALEDVTAADPATLHAVPFADARAGVTTVIATDRVWLTHTLNTVTRHGCHVDSVLPLSAVFAAAHGVGRIVQSADGVTLVTGRTHSVFLDTPLDAAQLNATAEQMKRFFSGIARVQWVNTAPDLPRIAAPLSATGVGIESEQTTTLAAWLQSHAPANDLNLLTGALKQMFSGTTRRWSGIATVLKPAAWIAAAAIVVHVGFMGWQSWSLGNRVHETRLAMNQLFKERFPEAQTIVDPALQMRRQREALERERGGASPTDFVPLLAASEAVAVGGVKITRGEYKKGQLELFCQCDATLREQTQSRLPAGVRIVAESPAKTAERHP